MSFYSNHYRTGEEIQTGDHVTWAGQSGRVAFVLGDLDFPADWADNKDWFATEFKEGFMLETEAGGLVFENESDEDLEFVARNT